MVQSTEIRVSAAEMKILSSLREQPDGELRDLYRRLLLRLADFVSNPSCAEVQADGIPCASPAADCVVCLKLEDMLHALNEVLPNDRGRRIEPGSPDSPGFVDFIY